MIPCQHFFAYLLILTWHIYQVAGYGSGAPNTACTSMRPGHTGVSPQSSSTNPFTVTASSTTYSPGQTITVTITGSSFRGMLLQARQPGQTTPIGVFSNRPSNTKLKTCSSNSDSVTHSNTNQKSSGSTFTWTAPQTGVGNIEFVATLARSFSEYWMDVKSAELTEPSESTTSSSQPESGTDRGTNVAMTSKDNMATDVQRPTTVQQNQAQPTRKTISSGTRLGQSLSCVLIISFVTLLLK
ncbi:putative defense protein 3 [Ptychodera flava]|uniref:putative defense protein 3 n=1 Tax=Ptychodera flava TaxID=63121 RepID=UPI00396A7F6B